MAGDYDMHHGVNFSDLKSGWTDSIRHCINGVLGIRKHHRCVEDLIVW